MVFGGSESGVDCRNKVTVCSTFSLALFQQVTVTPNFFRLAKINESLAKKITARNEYDKTISETENAYMKILESSQNLLTVLKRESSSIKSSPKPDL